MWDIWPAVFAYSGLSIAGVAWRIHGAVQSLSVEEVGADVGTGTSPGGVLSVVSPGDGLRVLQGLLESRLTVGMLINLGCSAFLLLSLATKALFFGPLALQEAQKLAERLINYVLFKVLFLMAVVEFENAGALWLLWFALLGFLKMFAGLARDRFERLCASPAASMWSHGRTIAVLLLVLFSDLFCMHACVGLVKDAGVSSLLLLNFEAVIIALDTTQTLIQYGLHLAEGCMEFPLEGSSPQGRTCGTSSAAAWTEWRGAVLFHVNLACDLSNLLLTLGHYLHIWWRHGLAFQVIDAVLFLNVRALGIAVLRRIQQVVQYRRAMHNLRTAFPDATAEQLHEFNDDCAICKEPMAVAKRLPCKHLFHLACLRSWLDQGAAGTYSCPTCRASLLGSVPGHPSSSGPRPLATNTGAPAPPQDPADRTPRMGEGAGTFGGGFPGGGALGGGGGFGQAGLGQVEFGPELLGGVPEQARWDGGSAIRWSHIRPPRGAGAALGLGPGGERQQHWWWPFGQPGLADPDGQTGTGAPPGRQALSAAGLRFRGQRGTGAGAGAGAGAGTSSPPPGPSDNPNPNPNPNLNLNPSQNHDHTHTPNPRRLLAEETRFAAMAVRVQEVLPHLSRPLILQDLRQTNSVEATVENLLEAGL